MSRKSSDTYQNQEEPERAKPGYLTPYYQEHIYSTHIVQGTLIEDSQDICIEYLGKIPEFQPGISNWLVHKYPLAQERQEYWQAQAGPRQGHLERAEFERIPGTNDSIQIRFYLIEQQDCLINKRTELIQRVV